MGNILFSKNAVLFGLSVVLGDILPENGCKISTNNWFFQIKCENLLKKVKIITIFLAYFKKLY